MFKISWPALATLGLLIFCNSALAQSATDQSVNGNKTSQDVGATEVPQSKTATPIPLPFPIQVIQDTEEEEAARANQLRSEKHDSDDLEAQRKAADAAERSAISAEWQQGATVAQIVFAAVGTAGLLLSLWLTWRALHQARDTDQRTLRAYMVAQPVFLVRPDASGFIRIKIRLENFGQTFALRVRSHCEIELFPVTLPDGFTLPPIDDIRNAETTMAPREEFNFIVSSKRSFSREVFVEIAEKRLAVIIWGVVDYDDVFGQSRRTQFCRRVIGNDTSLHKVFLTEEDGEFPVGFESIGIHNECT